MALTKIKCIPIMINLSNVLRSRYITARDQSMVESGVTEGVKTLPVFFCVDEPNNSNKKPQQAKEQRFSKLSQRTISS